MKIIKNNPILKNITNSAIKAWNGEEKLWKVFWLWGVLFYISSFCVILFGYWFFSELVHYKLEKLNILIAIFALFYYIFIFLCAFTIAFIYPMIFLFFLNRCCHNKFSKVVIKLFAIFAICGHFLFAMLCGMEMLFYLRRTSDSAYLVVNKITDYIYNKTTENIVYSNMEIYILLTGLIYLIILCYLINALIRFLNQNTKLHRNKLSFKKLLHTVLFFIIIMVCFLLLYIEPADH